MGRRVRQWIIWIVGWPSNTARTSAQKDTWAEVLYALDASGNGQLDRSIWLYDEHEGMSHYAKALLALTLNDIDEDATRTTELLNELVDAAILDASGVHWEEDEDSPWAMNTNTRSSAVVLLAIEQLDPENGFLPSAVRWLVSARESDYWSTTQENVWSILALTQHMLNTGELTASFTMSASVNGVERIKGEVSSDTIDQTAAVSIAIEDLNLDDVNQILLEKNGVGELLLQRIPALLRASRGYRGAGQGHLCHAQLCLARFGRASDHSYGQRHAFGQADFGSAARSALFGHRRPAARRLRGSRSRTGYCQPACLQSLRLPVNLAGPTIGPGTIRCGPAG